MLVLWGGRDNSAPSSKMYFAKGFARNTEELILYTLDKGFPWIGFYFSSSLTFYLPVHKSVLDDIMQLYHHLHYGSSYPLEQQQVSVFLISSPLSIRHQRLSTSFSYTLHFSKQKSNQFMAEIAKILFLSKPCVRVS